VKRPTFCYAFVLSLVASVPALAADWATYRGNPQRTGNTDGIPGPAAPQVLWSVQSQVHFVASPIPAGDRIIVSGLGAFNAPTVLALSIDPTAAQRVTWKKSVPYLKLPTVSTPAFADGKLVFGDGMHQNNGAVLYCIRQDTGRSIWQLNLPGTLVHVEGSPTVVEGRVFLGAGSAGVICVDMHRVMFDGKEMTTAEIQKVLDAKWADLQAKYQEELNKKNQFAAPPRDDQLPKPAPFKIWQQGEDKWHVDAPVAVAGGLVLVASSFLDKEMQGDRALFALDAKSGAVKWRAPLRINPWSGPAVSGKTVIVCGSTASFDLKMLKGAKGDVIAFDLVSGQEKWRKEVTTGGILGCPALTDELVITTATDGKVRAFSLADGERRWIYEARTPFFAPVALGKGVGYAGDLKGEIHAINLADGTSKWKFDLGAEATLKSPGGIYGGPVLHGGRLFVATCNLDGAFAREPTVVVCLGDK
jgi:outer membrane protein assembly factor BamB